MFLYLLLLISSIWRCSSINVITFSIRTVVFISSNVVDIILLVVLKLSTSLLVVFIRILALLYIYVFMLHSKLE